MTKKNQKEADSTLVKNVTDLIGRVPASTSIVEVLSLAVTERRSERIAEIDVRLQALEDAGCFKLEHLKDNDQFVDIAGQAIAMSIKTSDREKIKVFQNVIVNAAIGEHPDQTKSSIFINLIDGFTSLHIKILSFFQDPARWFESHNIPIPNTTMGAMMTVVVAAFPELREQKEIVHLVWADLGRAGFHSSAELSTMMTKDGMMAKRTTLLADEFLNFIKDADTSQL